MTPEVVAAVLEAARRRFGPGTRVVASRAASPELLLALGDTFSMRIAPAVRGRTVWADDVDGCVVEQPNWDGRRERQPAVESIVVQSHSGALVETGTERILETGDRVAPEAPTIGARRSPEIDAAADLAKRARQVRGVTLAHRLPEAPWFVVLLPVDPRPIATRLRSLGFAAEPVRRPELPGGLRLSVRGRAENRTIREYAASFAAAVAALRSGG